MQNNECIYFFNKQNGTSIFKNQDKLGALRYYCQLNNYYGTKCFCTSCIEDTAPFKDMLRYIDKKSGRVNVIVDTMLSVPENLTVILKKLAKGQIVLLVDEWTVIDVK